MEIESKNQFGSPMDEEMDLESARNQQTSRPLVDDKSEELI